MPPHAFAYAVPRRLSPARRPRVDEPACVRRVFIPGEPCRSASLWTRFSTRRPEPQ